MASRLEIDQASGHARAAHIREAFGLEWVTAGWMLIEAAVAIGSGVAAHSLTLTAFGVDSVIELLSACVLLWRLNVELRLGHEFSEKVERRAARLGGALLIALTAYAVASAVWGLWRGAGQDVSVPGLVLVTLAMLIMYGLARAKTRIAIAIGSAALRRCRRVHRLRLPFGRGRDRALGPMADRSVVDRWNKRTCPDAVSPQGGT